MQLWITTNIKQTQPEYAQVSLNPEEKINKLQLLSSSGSDCSISIKQDTDIYVSLLAEKM